MSEPKPSKRGSYYGERSLEGEWYWHGTGAPEDDWVKAPQTPAAKALEPAPLVAPNLAKSHVQTLPVMDYANPAKFSLPAPPAGLTWWYMANCWPRHDIIRVNGLT
jgi:hypothetical protein